MKLCIVCHERPATIPAKRPSHSWCQPCWYAKPCNQKAQRINGNPKRREQVRLASRRADKRTLYLGRRRVGYAKTPEQAQVIRAHIRRRSAEFRKSQMEAPC